MAVYLDARKKHKKSPVYAGIDFGTTHTIAVLADNGAYPVLNLPFQYEGEQLLCDHVPSQIGFYKGRFYYGPAAVKCFIDNYDDGAVLISSIKRSLQDWYEGKTIKIDDNEFEVEKLLTDYLRRIRYSILQALDLKRASIRAVIAVPANASSSQRYVTLNCFKQAGFKVVKILDEPVASGIQFVHERYKRWDRVESNVIIYDLGGGTFDATLLSISRGEYDPVVSKGLSRLGGDDFDAVLLKLAENQLGCEFKGRERLEMLQAVREVKEGVGVYTKKLHIDSSRGAAAVSLKDFQDAAASLLQRTVDLVEELLKDKPREIEQPDRIVTVGGGSLLNIVPRMLKDVFGKAKIHQGLYPFASVAIGAAIQAESPDLRVKDRLQRHFGVLRTREDGSEYVDVIFDKGMELPKRGRANIVSKPPYDPRHNIGRLRFLECDGVNFETGRPEGEAIYWNEILFPYDKTVEIDDVAARDVKNAVIRHTDELAGERILEEYFLDEYGIVTARISRTVQDGFSNRYNLFKR